MHKKGLLSGPKFNRRHTSVTPDAELFVRAAKERPEVSKVVLGPILKSRGSDLRVTYRVIPAGLNLKVRGHGQAQQLFVFTPTPHETGRAIVESARRRA